MKNNGNMITRLAEGWLRFSLHRPRLVLLFVLVVTVAVAWGGGRITVSGDYRAFFDADNPDLLALDAIEETYAKVDSVIVVMRFDDGDLFTPKRLSYIADLTDRLWQTPSATRVDSIANHQHSWAEGDDMMVADLVPVGEQLSAPDARRIKNIALSEPALAGYLVAADGKTASLVVRLHPEKGKSEALAEAVRYVRAFVAKETAAQRNMRMAIVGAAPLDLALREASERDARVLAPIMIGVLLLGLWLFFRGWRPALAVVIVVFATIAATLGVMGYAHIPLMTATAAVPVIVLTIAVADAIHIIAAVQADLARLGGRIDTLARNRRALLSTDVSTSQSLHNAITASVRINFEPVLITSLTTAIGFLSLNFADAPPYRDVGNLAAAGSVFALFFTVIGLPALLLLLPPPARAVRGGQGHWYLRLAALINKFSLLLILFFIGLLGAAIFALPKLHINDKFVDYFAPHMTFRKDAEFASKHLPGHYTLEFSLPAGEEGGIAEPVYLKRVAAFAAWLEEQPGVTHVVSITDIMTRLNRNMHGDDPAFYRLPDGRALAAQYLLLYELSLPYGRDLNNQIDVAKSASRVTAVMDDISTAQMQLLERRAEQWLKDNAPSGLNADGTGVAIIFAHLTERTVKSMLVGTAIAVVAIALSVFIALRSWPLALLSMVVNVVPVTLVFGLWAVMVGDIGLYVAAVVSVSLGLIVDFAIHILSKFRRYSLSGETVNTAMAHALEVVGPALVVSAGALILGFSVLLAADFTINAYLGAMTALTVAAALITDLILLPAIILATARKGREK